MIELYDGLHVGSTCELNHLEVLATGTLVLNRNSEVRIAA